MGRLQTIQHLTTTLEVQRAKLKETVMQQVYNYFSA